MRLVIVGAPGAGKGTQASGIASHFGIPAISTGEIFRANIKNQTDLGVQVAAIIADGGLVSDEITDAIVADRLDQADAAEGFLLDGYPRNEHQVEALDGYLADHGAKLDAVISLVVDPEVLVDRLLKRAAIEGRADDNEATIRHRMEVYTAETEPLLTIYRQRGLLLEVNGLGDVAEVGQRITAALEERLGR